MILKKLAIATILFYKIRLKLAKHLQARTFNGLSLHSEAIAPIREK